MQISLKEAEIWVLYIECFLRLKANSHRCWILNKFDQCELHHNKQNPSKKLKTKPILSIMLLRQQTWLWQSSLCSHNKTGSWSHERPPGQAPWAKVESVTPPPVPTHLPTRVSLSPPACHCRWLRTLLATRGSPLPLRGAWPQFCRRNSALLPWGSLGWGQRWRSRM